MKVMKIEIKSEQEANNEFKEVFRAAQKKISFKPKTGVYFTSLEAVRNFLTKKRLELLHTIKEKKPGSIYELAKLSRRNFPSVLKDITILSKHGLVKLTKALGSPRRAVQMKVGYDSINLSIGI